ncbi:hypothetical protein ACNKHQ_19870 [Shigella flexneri]
MAQNGVLKPEIVCAVSESPNCWVNDARVLANAQMVVKQGGEVRPGLAPSQQNVENGLWMVEAEDRQRREVPLASSRPGERRRPSVKQTFDDGMHLPSPYGIRLIKGSHIVVRACTLRSRPTSCKTKISVLSW